MCVILYYSNIFPYRHSRYIQRCVKIKLIYNNYQELKLISNNNNQDLKLIIYCTSVSSLKDEYVTLYFTATFLVIDLYILES